MEINVYRIVFASQLSHAASKFIYKLISFAHCCHKIEKIKLIILFQYIERTQKKKKENTRPTNRTNNMNTICLKYRVISSHAQVDDRNKHFSFDKKKIKNNRKLI
jgi:hypothetical protein